MSRRPGNLSRQSRNPWEENDNVSQTANSGIASSRPNPVPQPPPVHQHGNRGGVQDPWTLFQERVRTGPFGLSRFPSQPHSPIRVPVLDGGTTEMVNQRLQQFIRDSPPRVRGQWEMGFTPRQEEPGLSHAEFKRAMSKLRTDIFNPVYPRKSAYKRGLFSSRVSRTSNNETNHAEEDDDDGKDCTICLEEFVANQRVLITPCNHMFHKECITPWVKSHGKCPVCRFVLGERREQSRNNNTANIRTTNISETLNLIALIRAMEEAMDWVDAPAY